MDKLLEIQQELPKIGKDANNPYFSSSYLSLEKLLDTLRPMLNNRGLLLVQYPAYTANEASTLETIIYDGDKKVIENSMLLVSKTQDPQAQGSAITYARRYALMAIFGIVPAETDDDGNAASPAPIEKAMSKAQWASLGHLLDEKGITSRDDKIWLIRRLGGDKPLNTSAYNRLEKDINLLSADAAKEIIMEKENG